LIKKLKGIGTANFGVDCSLHFGWDVFGEFLIGLLCQKVDFQCASGKSSVRDDQNFKRSFHQKINFQCASGKSGVRDIKKLQHQIGQVAQSNLPSQPLSFIRSFREFLPTRGLSLRHGARWNPHRMPCAPASDAGTPDFCLLALTVGRSSASKSIAWISCKHKEGMIKYFSKLALGVRKSDDSGMKAEIANLPDYVPMIEPTTITESAVS
jgi:hypothetical protein